MALVHGLEKAIDIAFGKDIESLICSRNEMRVYMVRNVGLSAEYTPWSR